MESKPLSFEIKVGIFVFIGILIMFIIVFSIGELYILKPIYRVKVVFDFANGIAVGSPVRLAGVQVGEIDNIGVYYDKEDKRTRVLLSAKLKKEFKIEKDSECTINTLGLLGEKYLEITPGTVESGYIKEGDLIIGHNPISMAEVTMNVKELTESAKLMTESAQSILKRIEDGQGTVGKLLVEEEIYNDLRMFVKDIRYNPWKLLRKGKEVIVEEGGIRVKEDSADSTKGNRGVIR